MIDASREQELTGGGDTMLHYHNQDRGPFPIAHGSFTSTSSQAIASTTTAYAMMFDHALISRGVSLVDGSKITATTPGTYNIQFSCQLANTDSAAHDINIWFRHNGVNESDSNTVVDVPSKHGGTHGHTVAAWNFFVEIERGDYVELMFSGDSTALSLEYFTPQVSPTRPATPSIILTAHLVSV